MYTIFWEYNTIHNGNDNTIIIQFHHWLVAAAVKGT